MKLADEQVGWITARKYSHRPALWHRWTGYATRQEGVTIYRPFCGLRLVNAHTLPGSANMTGLRICSKCDKVAKI